MIETQNDTILAADTLVNKKHLYLESYGCAMNFADSEVVASIMAEAGYDTTKNEDEADLILINTCSIREKAEQTIRKRLVHLKGSKRRRPGLKVGILGCMAERLKKDLLEEEKLVDLVVGPDAYRDLPQLLQDVDDGQKAINVILSLEETYGEIQPTRLDTNGVTAFISIMRGCDNMCSFCVVPYTRGRERSRDPKSIIMEAQQLFEAGYKEVTLLGQNVDSYLWYGGGPKKAFKKLSQEERDSSVDFAQLLEKVAQVSPQLRVRFSTSHPKDIVDDVLYTMKRHKNICNYIHFPAQSGNDRILEKMNRTYDRAWYIQKLDRIREIIPDCGISCDIISGFCTETEEEHKDTISLMEYAEYDFSYMYFYSERPGTLAAKKYADDVPLEVKKRRLAEIIELQSSLSKKKNAQKVGKVFEVLIEKESKKSKDEWMGRIDQNISVIFPKENTKKGDYVQVEIHSSTTNTLIGTLVSK